MRETKPGGKFLRDLMRIKDRGYDIALLTAVIKALAAGGILDKRHRDHKLKGKLNGYSECHVAPDWLLVYHVSGNTLHLARTGTHTEVFGG